MMEVRFKNFRCFKDTEFLELKKITVLVGENSSGKTSFLGGLRHLSGLITGDNVDLNSAPFEMGSFKDIVYQSRGKEKISTFQYEWKIVNNVYRWTFEDKHGDSSLQEFTAKSLDTQEPSMIILRKGKAILRVKLSSKEVKLLKQFGAVVSPRTNEGGYHQVELNLKGGISNLALVTLQRAFDLRFFFFLLEKEILEQMLSREDRHLESTDNSLRSKSPIKGLRDLSSQLSKQLRHLAPSRSQSHKNTIAHAPLRTEPERVYSHGRSQRDGDDPSGSYVPMKLLKYSKSNDESWTKLSDTLSMFGEKAGLFKKVEVKSLSRNSTYPFSILIKTNQGRTSNIMDVGYGVSQILPLVFDVISVTGPVLFLLQQPEVHLHPRAQAEFGSLIAKLAKDKREFVIETHSDYIIDRIKYEIKQQTIKASDVGILFFEQNKSNTIVHQIELDSDGLPIKPPLSYRRFFLEELDKVCP